MKIGLVFTALLGLGVLAANPSQAQKTVTRPPSLNATRPTVSHPGAIGGAVNRGPSISGTGAKHKH
jgi:hypothetical protein